MARQLVTQQPKQAPQIDWGNPITRGLIVAHTGSSAFRNLVNGAVLPPIGTTPLSTRDNKLTPSFGGDAANSGISVSNAALYGPSAMTAYSLCRPDAITTDTTGRLLWSRQHPTLGTSFGFDYSRNDGLGGSGFRLYINGISGSPQELLQDYSANLPGDREYSVGVSVTPNRGVIFVNGMEFKASTTLDPIASSSGETQIGTSDYPPGGRDAFLGTISLSLFWNRGLSRSEMASLTKNPWQVFKPSAHQTRRVWDEEPLVVDSPFGAGFSLANRAWEHHNEGFLAAVLGNSMAELPSANVGDVNADLAAGYDNDTPVEPVVWRFQHSVFESLFANAPWSTQDAPAASAEFGASVEALTTATAALTNSIQLAASATVQTTATAALSGASSELQANASAVVTIAATLSTSIRLAASANSQATATAALTNSTRLAASGSGQCSATAALTTSIRMAAAADSVVTVNASLAGATAFVANAQAQCTATAALSTSVRMAAAAQALATVSATLTKPILLAASAVGQATSTAALTTSIRLSASATAATTLTAALATGTGSSAAASCATTITAALSTAAPLSTANAVSLVTATANLVTSVRMAAQALANAQASANLGAQVAFAAAALVETTTTAELLVLITVDDSESEAWVYSVVAQDLYFDVPKQSLNFDVPAATIEFQTPR